MAQELVKMSSKELDRLAVVRHVLEQRLTQAKAGEMMGLSARQVRRLCVAYERGGPTGLTSRKLGRPSNRRLPLELQAAAIEIIRERYADSGRSSRRRSFSICTASASQRKRCASG